MTRDVLDPKGLISEAYRIDGIGPEECRSIFLDWAISVPLGVETDAMIATLLARHGAKHPDHPMTRVLREGLGTLPKPVRKGGARRRRG